MGKLADRIKAMARGAAPPIGFALAPPRAQPPSLLVAALLDATGGEGMAQAIQDGADVVLVPVGPATGEAALKAVRSALRQAMWGAVLEVGNKQDVERLQKAGCDFVVLRGGALSADVLSIEELDTLLEPDPAWEDTLLRGVEQLPVLAILYRVVAEAVTIQQLLQVQRLVGLTRKPLLVVLPPTVSPQQLRPLRDAGVSGVVVPPASVKDFRAAVRDLPPPKKPKERAEVLLPLGLPPTQEEAEEEEEW